MRSDDLSDVQERACPMTSLDQSPSPAAGRKAARIIAAAREAFLEKGYDGVSMDEVAKRAGVAKQTVYARYVSKDALFLAVMDSVHRRVLSALSTPGPLAIRERLRRIAREFLELALDPSTLSLLRIAMAASYRFPTLGHSVWGADVKDSHAVLADIIERAAKEGSLRADDPNAAAQQFLALVKGELQLHGLLDPGFRPSRVKIKRQIDAAIDCFMARYGAPPASSA
jgi:TetR/AcrR family transcriptional regulator, mexJK operon transcriptional repressor